MRLGYRKKCQTEVQKKKKKKIYHSAHCNLNGSLPHVCSSPCDTEVSRSAGRAAAQPDCILLREDVGAAGGEMQNKMQFSSFPRGCSLACSGPV